MLGQDISTGDGFLFFRLRLTVWLSGCLTVRDALGGLKKLSFSKRGHRDFLRLGVSFFFLQSTLGCKMEDIRAVKN
jgi:hypothetical protein